MILAPFALAAVVVGAGSAPDTEPPIIEDLAAAASNPEAQPVVTVMLSDPGTGVGTANVFYRGRGFNTWSKASLKGATSGLFIARLPDGLQKTGFDYYVEATDVAGNGPTRIGSTDTPIKVEAATEATMKVLARQEAARVEPRPPIDPAWLMLSLGVGVLAGAGCGAYALDIVGTGRKIDDVNDRLNDPGISAKTKTALETSRTALQTASVQDTVIATVLGIVGAAGLATGSTLVVIASLE